MKPQPRTGEQQKNNSPNPDFKSAANAPKIPPKKNRKPNNKNYAVMTHLGLLVSKLFNELRVKKKREGRVFSFLRLVLGLRKAVSLESFVLKNCGCNI
jgi:hypothetical protein